MALEPSSSLYRLSNLENVRPGEIVSASKEEEWTTEKKKTNHKIRNVQTKVQRHLVLEDGVVIADSGTKVSTHTDEQNESDATDEEVEKDYQVRESDRLKILRSDPTWEELPFQQQVVEQRASTCQLSRQRRQEHFRFEDDEIGQLDGERVHRLAVDNPDLLLAQSQSPDVLADDPSIIRGRLTHFESKGLKQVDRLQTNERDLVDEHGVRTTERIQNHEHEWMDEDEVPQRLYDNDKYVHELKHLAGRHFDRIPPEEYAPEAVRLPHSNDRYVHKPTLPVAARGPVEQLDKYEHHESMLEHRHRHYGGEHRNETHRPTGRTITFDSSNARRKEDAGVQACYLTSDSDSESEVEVKVHRGILRSPSPRAPTPSGKSITFEEPVRPARTYYFGEKDNLNTMSSPEISHWSSNTHYELKDNYGGDRLKLYEKDANNNYLFGSLTSNHLAGGSGSQKYAYPVSDTIKPIKGLEPLPPIGNVNYKRRTFENVNSSAYGGDLDIPLRRDWADKIPPSRPAYSHFRSSSYTFPVSTPSTPVDSAIGSSSIHHRSLHSPINAPMDTSVHSIQSKDQPKVSTKWRDFSPLSSPSELISAATLKRSNAKSSTNY